MTIQEIFHVKATASDVKEVMEWLDKDEFSFQEYSMMLGKTHAVERTLEELKHKMRLRKELIDKEDWRLFYRDSSFAR